MASGPNTLEYKVGEIFGEIKNKIHSGYSLRDIIEHIDALRFRSQVEKHELSHLYEAKIKNMGSAGRNMGKTTPLNDADLTEFVALQSTFADSVKTWSVDVADVTNGDATTFDLSVKNPNGGEAVTHRSPQDIMDEIAALDAQAAEVLKTIR